MFQINYPHTLAPCVNC